MYKGLLSSLRISGTLHSVGDIFPFLPCLSLFFPRLFVKPPQTMALPSCISFPLGWFSTLSLTQRYKPRSVVLRAPVRQVSLLPPTVATAVHSRQQVKQFSMYACPTETGNTADSQIFIFKLWVTIHYYFIFLLKFLPPLLLIGRSFNWCL